MSFKKSILYLICLLFSIDTYGQNLGENIVYAGETLLAQVDPVDVKNQIEIYPNPSIDFIIINIQNSELENVKFKLHSIIGNTVEIEAEVIGKSKFKIDLKEYSSGYYFLIVEDEYTAFKEAYKFLKN